MEVICLRDMVSQLQNNDIYLSDSDQVHAYAYRCNSA